MVQIVANRSEMRCAFCSRPAPIGIQELNFCVYCGKPVRQICPYESDKLPPPLVFLQTQEGLPAAFCPSCAGIFKTCDTCHRLHTLESVRCITIGCDGNLIEPDTPFATPGGPQNGSAGIPWNQALSTVQEAGEPFAYEEPARSLIYRYGSLFLLGDRNLTRFRMMPEAGWTIMGRTPLPIQNANIKPGSLIVDQGRIFLLAEGRAISFNIQNQMAHDIVDCDGVNCHAAGAEWWALVGRQTVTITDLHDHSVRELPLPDSFETAENAVSSEESLYITDQQGGILHIDISSGKTSSYCEEGIRWVRLACMNEMLVSLGIHQNGEAEAASFEPESLARIAHRAIGRIQNLDFCCNEQSLFLTRSANTQFSVERYRINNLSFEPEIRQLQANLQMQSGMLSLTNPAGETKLILPLKQGKLIYYALFDFETGRQDQIGPYVAANGSAICLAHNRVVIARSDNSGCQLHTFQLQESAQ